MRDYIIYKLSFPVGVHLGEGNLNTSVMNCRADTLFSALYIEAMKQGKDKEFYEAAVQGHLLWSDLFPYDKENLYLPKPMIPIATADEGNSVEKKFYKKLKYILALEMDDYLAGKMEHVDKAKDICAFSARTFAAIKGKVDTLPYQVGITHFEEDTGLYAIVATENKEAADLFDELIESLATSGIGGKRASGLGKFEFYRENLPKYIKEKLDSTTGRCMLLATSLPAEGELEESLQGASYTLVPRSGFVYSETYAEEQQRKRTVYLMDAGSCFDRRFSGDILDVARGEKHPVYRYAKPLFMAL